MNIKIKKTDKVHKVGVEYDLMQAVWLRCGNVYFSPEYQNTTDPVTCKTCIKLEAKK